MKAFHQLTVPYIHAAHDLFLLEMPSMIPGISRS
jgi:hypothetical protein